jgi:hypothetical protein
MTFRPQRWLILSLTLLWVLPNLRSISTMSYDWDAAQYSLATVDFDLARHQPHPPGYPLWVFALRAMAPATHGAPLAQTILDIAFTLAALFCVNRLASEWLGRQDARKLALLLAFSPTVQLYAFAQSTYPVDLLASALLGWLAWRMWHGNLAALRFALPVAALLMGFRPSGVVMLAPLLGVAALRCCRRRPAQLVLPVLAAAGLIAGWFWPLALASGGVSEWVRLNRELFGSTAGATSVLFGAPLHLGPPIALRLTLILGVALAPLAGLLVARRRRTPPASPWPWGFLALWAVPGLLFSYLIHFGKPGYLLLVLPPLYLALGAIRPTWRLVLVGLVLAETLVMLPYDRIPENKLTRAVAQATPHAATMAARDNRMLREQIDRLCPARIICADEFKEAAPNRRTVAYDFPQLRGSGEPVFLTTLTAKQPAGTRLVCLGKSFALWQAVGAGD